MRPKKQVKMVSNAQKNPKLARESWKQNEVVIVKVFFTSGTK